MEFLTTKGIAASVEKIIRNASDFIVIVSPYVKIDKTYIDRLCEAEKNGVEIDIIFGKEDMRDFEKEKFQNFHNINTYFLENLHAKCYLNESTALITSMNLYGYSEQNNREMGIEIDKDRNYELYCEIIKETNSIKDSAELYQINRRSYNRTASSFRVYDSRKYNQGYCIRCRNQVEIDIENPLCPNCYSVWSLYGNADYPENFCHKCGRQINFRNERRIDYNHPLCSDCWYNS